MLDGPSNALDVDALLDREKPLLDLCQVRSLILHDQWFLNCVAANLMRRNSRIEFAQGALLRGRLSLGALRFAELITIRTDFRGCEEMEKCPQQDDYRADLGFLMAGCSDAVVV